MPDLSTLLRMQMANDQAPINSINEIGRTLTDVLERRGQKDVQSAAMDFFKDKPVDLNSINEFSQMYPNVDKREIFQYAGTLAQHKEAQELKDMFSTLQSHIQTTGEPPDNKTLAEMFQGKNPQTIIKLQQYMAAVKQMNPDFTLNAGDKRFKTLNGNAVPVAENPKMVRGWISSPDGTQKMEIDLNSDLYKEKKAAGWFDGEPTGISQAHNYVEVFSPDGTKAQKMQFNPTTKKYDIPIGEPYAVKSQVINVNNGEKETEADKLYKDYLTKFAEDKKAGKYNDTQRAFTRYEFTNWMNTQKAGGAAEAKSDVKREAIVKTLETINAQYGNKNHTVNPSPRPTLPAGAQTGTYNGIRAYTLDGKTFYDINGKELK
jgi:hypothetical protein